MQFKIFTSLQLMLMTFGITALVLQLCGVIDWSWGFIIVPLVFGAAGLLISPIIAAVLIAGAVDFRETE